MQPRAVPPAVAHLIDGLARLVQPAVGVYVTAYQSVPFSLDVMSVRTAAIIVISSVIGQYLVFFTTSDGVAGAPLVAVVITCIGGIMILPILPFVFLFQCLPGQQPKLLTSIVATAAAACFWSFVVRQISKRRRRQII